jgi:membrane protease YdiL (CAAX protease family)
MEPETQDGAGSSGKAMSDAGAAGEGAQPAAQPGVRPGPPEPGDGLRWIFLGPDGLRAGWSVAIFLAALAALAVALGTAFEKLGLLNPRGGFTPGNMFFNEAASLLALAGAGLAAAQAERRHLADYNLRDARRLRHFFSGLAAGFIALSALVGALAAGGWLRFGGVELSHGAAARYALLWGATFLLTGFFEEGTFRCYLQYTLTRGLNFPWALGLMALICAGVAAATRGTGGWGIYAIAVLGVAPCYLLHRRGCAGSPFWQAAWITSALFGLAHAGNGGENWIGIFAAAAIGFVFCVSVRLTGSAWWAIGCHAGWDWSETYFYGTPDSGLVARGHLLATTHSGNPLWSGGADGPEGSLLALGVIVLLLVWLTAAYGRGKAASSGGVIL